MAILTTKKALVSFVLSLSILSVSSQALNERTSEFFDHKSYVKNFEDQNIVEIFEGTWGDFKGMSSPVPLREFTLLACGASLQIQDDIKRTDYDNTAVNGLKLHFCGDGVINPWNVKSYRTIFKGERGYFKRQVMCPNGTYIVGAQVQSQNLISGDNVAITGLKIKCAKLNRKGGVMTKTVHRGERGEFKSWVTFPKNKGVIAAEVQYMDYDFNKDNTGMNGIRFEVSPPKRTLGVTIENCATKKKRGSCRQEDQCAWMSKENKCMTCADSNPEDCKSSRCTLDSTDPNRPICF